jgi:hypothetical protein
MDRLRFEWMLFFNLSNGIDAIHAHVNTLDIWVLLDSLKFMQKISTQKLYLADPNKFSFALAVIYVCRFQPYVS